MYRSWIQGLFSIFMYLDSSRWDLAREANLTVLLTQLLLYSDLQRNELVQKHWVNITFNSLMILTLHFMAPLVNYSQHNTLFYYVCRRLNSFRFIHMMINFIVHMTHEAWKWGNEPSWSQCCIISATSTVVHVHYVLTIASCCFITSLTLVGCLMNQSIPSPTSGCYWRHQTRPLCLSRCSDSMHARVQSDYHWSCLSGVLFAYSLVACSHVLCVFDMVCYCNICDAPLHAIHYPAVNGSTTLECGVIFPVTMVTMCLKCFVWNIIVYHYVFGMYMYLALMVPLHFSGLPQGLGNCGASWRHSQGMQLHMYIQLSFFLCPVRKNVLCVHGLNNITPFVSHLDLYLPVAVTALTMRRRLYLHCICIVLLLVVLRGVMCDQTSLWCPEQESSAATWSSPAACHPLNHSLPCRWPTSE